MDLYLDSIVITKDGIIIFKWDGLLKYNSQTIEWGSIQMIEDKQSGLLDILLSKGDIVIRAGAENHVFNDIPTPTKQKNDILEFKDKFEEKPEAEPQDEIQLDKFDVLVETLGEVILDYIKKAKE